LRLAFLGTPDFSIAALDALIAAGHEVVCVYSQPPRPAGRGKALRPSPVHQAAEARGIEVRTPASLRSAEEQQAFTDLDLDAAVVVAYGLILPKAILDAPKHGCFNIHASLLPRWRGAAPIQRAILAGDRTSGVTIMQMDEGLDTGPMLAREEIAITASMTAGELHDTLSALGARMIVDALASVAAGTAEPIIQPQSGVTYAEKLRKEEAAIDWRRPAADVLLTIRAFNPFPGAFFMHGGERFRVLEADIVQVGGTPGHVLDADLAIACGDRAIRPRVIQRQGKKPMTLEELLRGFSIPAGTVLPLPEGA
jgi:methionyl-tRNA formyltransferase